LPTRGHGDGETSASHQPKRCTGTRLGRSTFSIARLDSSKKKKKAIGRKRKKAAQCVVHSNAKKSATGRREGRKADKDSDQSQDDLPKAKRGEKSGEPGSQGALKEHRRTSISLQHGEGKEKRDRT